MRFRHPCRHTPHVLHGPMGSFTESPSGTHLGTPLTRSVVLWGVPLKMKPTAAVLTTAYGWVLRQAIFWGGAASATATTTARCITETHRGPHMHGCALAHRGLVPHLRRHHQDEPMRPPRRPTEASKTASEGVCRAQTLQDLSRSPQENPRGPQEAPKRPQDAPKRLPRHFQEAPKMSQSGPMRAWTRPAPRRPCEPQSPFG